MYTLVADAWFSKAHKQDLSWSVEKGTRHRPKEQVAGVNCSNVGYQSRHQCAAVQLWVDLLGDLWGEEEKQTGVRVCVQVAQLELEAQRVQLEQEDAAHSGTSSEAMQRLQQQVCLSCLHAVSIWTWGLPAAALSALKYRLQISPFAVNCHGHGNSPFAFLRIICMRETLCICK